MSTKTKIKWRLGKLPTPDEVTLLLKEGVLTKEEAREILFSQETEEERDRASMESEIKFLRELVQRLSSTPTQIIQTIKAVEQPYIKYPWYGPYVTWCSSISDAIAGSQLLTSTGTTNAFYTVADGSFNTNGLSVSYSSSLSEPDFTAIKTF